MRVQQAIATINQLSKLNTTTVALTPEDYQGCGLPVVKKLVDAETRKPIFIYVNRLALIERLRQTHELERKGNTNALHRIIGC